MRIPAIAAALLACGLAIPAHAEVVQSGPGGFVIRHSVAVGSAPEAAWRELVKPADWWQSSHTFSGDAANLWIDSQATGCFCEKLPLPKGAPEGQRPGSVEHLRVVYVEPPRAIRMSGALGPLQSEALTGTLTIALSPGASGGTRIRLEYVVGGFMRMKPEEIAPAVDKMLGEQLASLAARLGPSLPPESAPAAPAGEGAPAPAEEGKPAG